MGAVNSIDRYVKVCHGYEYLSGSTGSEPRVHSSSTEVAEGTSIAEQPVFCSPVGGVLLSEAAEEMVEDITTSEVVDTTVVGVASEETAPDPVLQPMANDGVVTSGEVVSTVVTCNCAQSVDLTNLFKSYDGVAWDENAWATLEKWFTLHFSTEGCRYPRTTMDRGMYMIRTGRWKVNEVLLSVSCPTFWAIANDNGHIQRLFRQQMNYKDTHCRIARSRERDVSTMLYWTSDVFFGTSGSHYKLPRSCRWIFDRRNPDDGKNKLTRIVYEYYDWWYVDDRNHRYDRTREYSRNADLMDNAELDMPSVRRVHGSRTNDADVQHRWVSLRYITGTRFVAGTWKHFIDPVADRLEQEEEQRIERENERCRREQLNQQRLRWRRDYKEISATSIMRKKKEGFLACDAWYDWTDMPLRNFPVYHLPLLLKCCV